MDGTRGQLLARAGFSGEQHHDIALCSQPQSTKDFLYRRAFADELLKSLPRFLLLFSYGDLLVVENKRKVRSVKSPPRPPHCHGHL